MIDYLGENTSNSDAATSYASSDKSRKQENDIAVSKLSSRTSLPYTAVTVNVTPPKDKTSPAPLARQPSVTVISDHVPAAVIESTIPHAWLRRRATSNVSASSASSEESSAAADPTVDDANNTVVVIDLDNSEYSYNSQRDRHLTIK